MNFRELEKQLIDAGYTSKKVLVYPVVRTQEDPFEKTTEDTTLNPMAIRALVIPINFDALRWKYTGKVEVGSIQIICDKRHETILKLAGKIKIEDIYYRVYRDAERTVSMIKRPDYALFIAERTDD